MSRDSIAYVKHENVSFYLLIALLLILPVLEAPKNLFLVLFLVIWCKESVQSGDWGGRWTFIDTIFIVWILLDIVVGVNAIVTHNLPANGSKDLFKFLMVGWFVSRTLYTNSQILVLLVAIAVSALLPLIYLFYSCPDGGRCFELNSVGHVNHTAIFLVSVYATLLPLFILRYDKINHIINKLLGLTLLFLAYSIILTASRAAFGLLIITTLLTIFYSIVFYKNLIYSLFSIILISILSTTVIYSNPEVIKKFQNMDDPITGGEGRKKIRNFSYYAYKTNPFLGVGFGNFMELDRKDIEDAVIKDKGVFHKEKYLPFAHPHNVYYTYLVSGGILITFIFSLFWLYMARLILVLEKHVNEKWLAISGINVMLVVLGIGWVNTTLAHEGAILAMFVMGLVVSRYRKINYHSS